ncbi:elongation factor P maturation arginine rhamnosyltransferase EarP [Castellaniella sp.]|uniref:elongation factor P maturation arginine rhamnosyltransferase EarP n=1 Tax=Castellaniella sp. TaxID=1955812 RepID=UPI002AFEF63C|nr:elongation factor P maturation arginine rhamnosyltransferase EarP [Castellaniella sp.]
MNALTFDIFCRVVDNYGDAGVCWRLARQLAALGQTARLWIDDLPTLTRLAPGLDPAADRQTAHGVQIGTWHVAEQTSPPAHGIVIEAFACNLPARYQAAMAAHHCLWINLEYLSAESWVEGCHGLPSPQANGVPKYFYFPGFVPATGGLLRETHLLDHRRRTQVQDRRRRLQSLTGLQTDALPDDARVILLFCYPDAPWAGLQAALAQQSTPTWLLVPGQIPAGLQSQGALQVMPIPFVPQARFDELLWCCDLNFVRGEDSLVRALWAGVPLVWQIYRQDAEAHLDKLDAWLDRARWPAPVQALIRAWNRQDAAGVQHSLAQALRPDGWRTWQTRAAAWSEELAAMPDLARNLLSFCQKRLQKS